MKPKPKQEICSPCGYFSQGSKVEISNGQGAWLPGTILEPQSNPLPFSLRKRKALFLVQYDTLVLEDDPSMPLTEEVDVSSLRPAPPPDDNADFEPNDVVDAFNLDAWWPGVVMSVAGDKYTVGFKSPPDLLELGRGELRRHWDWRGGEWARADKEMMMRLIFSPGAEVEVNLHKERLWFAWLPAIYVGPLGGNSFLVQYKSANNGDGNGFVKEVVSDHQIRPLPPQQEERDFGLLTTVDAYDGMSWWVGDITKILTGKKYVIKFRFTNQEKEFSQSDLRHHSEWTGNEWVTNSMALQETMVYEELSRYARSSDRNSEGKTPCYTESPTKQLTRFMDESPYGNIINELKLLQHPNDGATFISTNPSKKLKGKHSEDSISLAELFGRTTPVKTPKRKGPLRDEEKSEQQQVWQLDSEATTPIKKKGRRRKSQVDSPSPSVRHGRKGRVPKLHVKKSSGIDKAYEQKLEDEHVMNGIESSDVGSEFEVMGGSHAGSSCLLPVEDNQQDEDGVSSGIKLKGKLPELLVEHSKDPTTGSEDLVRDGLDVVSSVEVQLAVSALPAKEPDHDQSLSLCIEEGQSVKTMEGSIRGTLVETGVKGDMEQKDGPNLPFVKSIPLWDNIQSMEVFKRFPQKPHFRPLLKTKEVFREGSAFGKMLAFSSLVDQTSKLRVGDPRDVIDSNLEATVELELHGFDVEGIKHRLTELLDLKVKLEELHNQSKVVESKIAESSHNRIKDTETISRIDKEIEDLEANIKGLQEKRAMVVSMCLAKDSEVSRLQSEAEVISESIQSVQHGFDTLAAAPW